MRGSTFGIRIAAVLAVVAASSFVPIRAQDRQAVPRLRKGREPSIINLASVAGHLGMPGRAPYSASKWAVVGFTKTLAIELGGDGIRVNAILPGAVDGPRIQAVIAAKAKALGKPVELIVEVWGDILPAGSKARERERPEIEPSE